MSRIKISLPLVMIGLLTIGSGCGDPADDAAVSGGEGVSPGSTESTTSSSSTTTDSAASSAASDGGGASTTTTSSGESFTDSSSDSDSSGTGATQTAQTQVGSIQISSGSALNAVVPTKTALSSITSIQSSSSLSKLSAAGQINIQSLQLSEASTGRDYLAQVELLEKTTTASAYADCLSAIPQEFNLAQGNFGHAACFGPSVSYTQHPDGEGDGNFGNGDLGMFFPFAEVDATSGEACSARVVNNLMNNVGAYANTAIGMQAMVACGARIAELELPEVGQSADYSSMLTNLELDQQEFAITSAAVSRLADDAQGYAVFETSLVGSLTDAPRGLTKEFTLKVRHIPTGNDNSTYKGSVQFDIHDFENSKDLLISLVYDLDSEGPSYRYRQAQFPDQTNDGFDATNLELDPSHSDVDKWVEVVSELDAYGFGKLAFVWNTFDLLVFNAQTASDGSGVAFFGHRSAEATTKGSADSRLIQGLRCFPKNPPPMGSEPYTAFVQKQTLALDASSGTWTASESKLAFAPTTSCSWDSSNDPSQAATFTVSKETQNGQENASMSYPTTADLFDYASYENDWTGPAGPAEFE